MARSWQCTPIIGMTTAFIEEQDKRQANRICRSALRRVLNDGEDLGAILLPILRNVSNPWAMAKDGRQWWVTEFPS